MDELRDFIDKMRQQGLSDELIYKNLIHKGWREELASEAFLPAGTEIPVPTEAKKIPATDQKGTPQAKTIPANQTDPSLDPKPSVNLVSGAQSALHHIFLWVFSLAFVVNIQIIINGIIEKDFTDNFSKILASSAVVLLITGVVYWLFYFRFIKALKQNYQLRLQGAWTLTTIVFGSLTAIGFLIGMVVSLIWSANFENIVRFAPIVVYCGLVVLNYVQINFASPQSKMRRRLAQVWYGVSVGLILAIAIVASGLTYLNRKTDLDLKKEVAETASKVYRYYQKERFLPETLADVGIKHNKFSYRKLSQPLKTVGYEICADFKHVDYRDASYYKQGNRRTQEIYMLGEEIPVNRIKVTEVGKNCFTFTADSNF